LTDINPEFAVAIYYKFWVKEFGAALRGKK
jgi:hypothetical protein